MAKQKITAHKTSETTQMQKLVGKTVKEVFYDDKNGYNQPIEGVYGLIFTDGTAASFSSSGDDMTCTSMNIEESR